MVRGKFWCPKGTAIKLVCSYRLSLMSLNDSELVSARISQTLHFQAMVRLAGLDSNEAEQSAGSAVTASITRSTIRAPRPQVKGLKMRFFPTGFGGDTPGTLGESDSEAEGLPEKAGFGVLIGRDLASRPEKRKHVLAEDAERVDSPSKKSRKPRSPEELKRKGERKAKKDRKRAQEAASSKS